MAPASNPAGSNATLRILLFYAAAIALGVLNGFYGTDLTIRAGDFLSSVFIRLFKFISIPIIAVSLISTLAQLGESRESAHDLLHALYDDHRRDRGGRALPSLRARQRVASDGGGKRPQGGRALLL